MHLGNADIEEDEGTSLAKLSDEKSLSLPAELFGVDEVVLRKGLIEPRIKAGDEVIAQHLSKEKAVASRDALARAIYQRLFSWLIKKINDSMNKPRHASFIGVLDIAGFEIFKNNSFEQLCINYTNEKLQQFFNQHMFKIEQEEYMREKIKWDFIDFGLDCQPVIDLIEKKRPPGILTLLDEQALIPDPSDKKFLESLNRKFGTGHHNFKQNRFNKPEFGIVHYAGLVTYTVKDWTEKNRDPLQHDLGECMRASKQFIGRLFKDDQSFNVTKSALFITVGSQHKDQLTALMNTLYLTSPHFVRCILPNNEKKQHCLTDRIVLDQLRCNGVLEGIRITRKGYPNRVVYAEFLKRYYFLGKDIPRSSADPKTSVLDLVKQIGLTEDKYAIGVTKIFFRTGVLAWIEEQREAKLSKLISGIQAASKAYLLRSRYKKLRDETRAVLIIQDSFRAYLESINNPCFRLMQIARRLIQPNKYKEKITQLELEIKELKQKLSTEKEEHDKVISELTKTKGDLGNLSAQLQSAHNDLDRLKDDNGSLTSDKNLLEQTIKKLEGEIKMRQKDIQELKKKISDSCLKNQEQKDILDSEKKKVAEFEARCKRLEDEVGEMRQEKERNTAQIRKLEKDSADKNEEIDELHKQLAQEKKSIATTEARNHELEEQITIMNETGKRIKDTAERELLDTKKRLAESEALVKQQKDEIERLKKREEVIKQLEAQLEDARNTQERAEKRQKALEDENSKILSKLEKEEDSHRKDVVAKRALDAELEQAMSKLASESAEKEKSEMQNKSLRQECEQLHKSLDDFELQAKTLYSKNQQLQRQLTELDEQLSSESQLRREAEHGKKVAENEAESIKAQLDDLSQRYSELKIQAQASEEEVTHLREEFSETALKFVEHGNQQKRSNNEIQQLKDELQQYQDQLSTSKKKIKSLQDRIDQHVCPTVDVSSETVKRKDEELNEIRNKLKTANEAREKAEKAKSELQLKLLNLESDYDEKIMDLQSRLRRKDAELFSRLDSIQEEADESERVKKEIEDQLKIVINERDELSRKLEEEVIAKKQLEEEKIRNYSELSALRTKNEALTITKRRLEQSKKHLEEELKEQEEIIDREIGNRVRLEEARTKIKKLESLSGDAQQLSTVRAELETTKARLRKTEEDLRTQKRENSILTQTIQKTNTQLEVERHRQKTFKSRFTALMTASESGDLLSVDKL